MPIKLAVCMSLFNCFKTSCFYCQMSRKIILRLFCSSSCFWPFWGFFLLDQLLHYSCDGLLQPLSTGDISFLFVIIMKCHNSPVTSDNAQEWSPGDNAEKSKTHYAILTQWHGAPIPQTHFKLIELSTLWSLRPICEQTITLQKH